jgi:hypothetical protein
MARTDHTGKTFNRLTAKRKAGEYYHCSCSCGGKALVRSDHLASGHTKSCGCLIAELIAAKERRKTDTALAKAALKKAKDTSAPALRNVWASMISRCTNPKDVSYPGYGGRGISVCERWLQSFENFYEDMRPRYRRGKSIDRRDNNGSYTPENCRWATPKMQSRNRRNTLVVVRADGIGTTTLPAVVEKHNLEYNAAYTVYKRLNAGLDEDRAPNEARVVLETRKNIDNRKNRT